MNIKEALGFADAKLGRKYKKAKVLKGKKLKLAKAKGPKTKKLHRARKMKAKGESLAQIKKSLSE